MRITLSDAGKRFNREWIFRHFNHQFTADKTYAITGPNGCGKSTLLQCLAGALMLTEGKLSYQAEPQITESQGAKPQVPKPQVTVPPGAKPQGPEPKVQFVRPVDARFPDTRLPGLTTTAEIPPEKIFRQIAFAAPYLEPVEEMTANEFFAFHQVFKPFRNSLSVAGLLDIVGLSHAADKQIRYYSSGMKQRVRLGQAFFSDTPVLLLDEPTTNLDAPGIALYHMLIENHTKGRLLIISSNEPAEYAFADEVLHLPDRTLRPASAVPVVPAGKTKETKP